MLLYVLVRLKECFRQTPPPPLPADCMLPELTLFITAYNEEDVVDDKMRNSLSLDYPADKLHILWITDGSNDRTNERLSHWPQVTVLYQPQREGKTAALNRGIRFVTTPLVVFTDANTQPTLGLANARTISRNASRLRCVLASVNTTSGVVTNRMPRFSTAVFPSLWG